jgi:hypothetical protein
MGKAIIYRSPLCTKTWNNFRGLWYMKSSLFWVSKVMREKISCILLRIHQDMLWYFFLPFLSFLKTKFEVFVFCVFFCWALVLFTDEVVRPKQHILPIFCSNNLPPLLFFFPSCTVSYIQLALLLYRTY